VGALWAAETLRALYPGRVPLSVGATECRVFLREKQPGRLAALLKTALLAAVLFFGGAVAIMTFHEDVNMPAVLSDIYAFFTGVRTDSVPAVTIPYSVGIVAGFVILLGLVHRKRHKPTLLELSVETQEKAQRDYMAEKDPDG
jgi:stage V sporulation protein AA